MIHIGSFIEQELRRQERLAAWFARKLHCALKIFIRFSKSKSLTHNCLSISVPNSNTISSLYYIKQSVDFILDKSAMQVWTKWKCFFATYIENC